MAINNLLLDKAEAALLLWPKDKPLTGYALIAALFVNMRAMERGEKLMSDNRASERHCNQCQYVTSFGCGQDCDDDHNKWELAEHLK